MLARSPERIFRIINIRLLEEANAKKLIKKKCIPKN